MLYNTNIISNFALFVKSDTDVNEVDLTKWSEHKKLSEKMAQKMLKAGFISRGVRMSNCSDTMSFSICDDCGKARIHHASLCRDKLCPTCMWRLAKQRYRCMSDILKIAAADEPNAVYSFMTLTVPNCKVEDLSNTLDMMSEAWKRFIQRVAFKESVKGYARSLEITYNAEKREMHPHYHFIVMFDCHEIADAYETKLLSDWLLVWRGSKASIKGQDIRRICSYDVGTEQDVAKAALEVYKYSVKETDLLNMPLGIFKEFVIAFKGRRVTAFGGLFKEYKKIVGIDTENVEDINDNGVCGFCCSKRCHDIVVRWSGLTGTYQKVVI